jgi:inorganic pyrophosphatase
MPGADHRFPDVFPDVVEVVVEIPRGSRNKYEWDDEAGVFRLDRVLSSAVFYDFDYGFAQGTRGGDGDHTDALLVIDEPPAKQRRETHDRSAAR